MCQTTLVVSDSWRPYGLQPTRLRWMQQEVGKDAPLVGTGGDFYRENKAAEQKNYVIGYHLSSCLFGKALISVTDLSFLGFNFLTLKHIQRLPR